MSPMMTAAAVLYLLKMILFITNEEPGPPLTNVQQCTTNVQHLTSFYFPDLIQFTISLYSPKQQ